MNKKHRIKPHRPGLKFKLGCFFFFIYVFSFITCSSQAQEVAVVLSGETHAMLYPCSCPKEADGGIARRASLIKELRKKNPHTLVLDAGSFFAGGLKDEYTQNTQLDRQRTLVNLKALDLMGYDAVCVGDDEFNFGREFLEENIGKTNIAFLCANIALKGALPYIVKEMAGIKIGIIGVISLNSQPKAGGIKFSDPEAAVRKTVKELKGKGVGIIVLLSQLSESDSLRLVNGLEGIDILVLGQAANAEEPLTKTGSLLVLRPSWQGRHLTRLSLTIEAGRITGHNLEQLRLSEEIAEDPDILSLLPRCFSDSNCRKKDLIGSCDRPGALDSSCVFTEPAKINLSILRPITCKACDNQPLLNFLKAQFPGLVISYLHYPGSPAEELVRDFGIKALPAYFFDQGIENEKAFEALKNNIDKKGGRYMLKPEFSGFAYFLGRKKIEGKTDLFISLYDTDTPELLGAIRELNPSLHFLAIEQSGAFDATKGNLEVEEYLRAVCVNKYSADNFWDYIICRAKNINSSWWPDCISGSVAGKIKTCAQGEEGKRLLEENIALNKELGVMLGPTYLIDNQEIFSSRGAPTTEALKKIMRDAGHEN